MGEKTSSPSLDESSKIIFGEKREKKMETKDNHRWKE